MPHKVYLLFSILMVSFLVSCSDGGSSNSDSRTDSSNSDRVEESSTCSEGFGDASRCETRDNL